MSKTGQPFFVFGIIIWSCVLFAQTRSAAAETFGVSSLRSVSKPWLEPRSESEEKGKDEEDDGEEEGVGRSFLFKELVLSGLYSFDGVTGLPPADLSEDHFEISPRPPGNYVGLDYVKTFTSSSFINKALPDWLPLTALDLHPRLVYVRTEKKGGLRRIKFAPQDFWLRFNPGRADRLTLRVGQFVLPYGVNPILAPRQRFLLPIEATDLGLKWDWGLDLKGPIGEYDWEIAFSIGSGEALHSPRWFSGSDRTSYLITGRVGSPTYWDGQHGFSFLIGDLPMIMGPAVLSDAAISRWRIAYDLFYKSRTYLMIGGQLTYGQNGFAGDDWVVPQYQNVRLAVQFESVFRDVATSRTDDTAVVFQVGYSLSTTVTAKLHYREELHRSMGEENDALYFTFVYYGF